MDSYSQAETLQKLERLTQLETMVAELRIRIEKYRTMYETIKTEHFELEEVCGNVDFLLGCVHHAFTCLSGMKVSHMQYFVPLGIERCVL